MDAIDTQELLDFLTKGEHAERLEKHFKEVEKRKGKIFLSNYTLLELVYILEKVYHVDRGMIVRSLKTLLEDRLFRVEAKAELERALEVYAQGSELLQALKQVQYEKVKARRLKL